MTDDRTLAIEGKIDRATTGAIAVVASAGALSFEKMGDMMDFSRIMAISDKAIKPFLRGNVGACLAITIQANEWGLSPYAVARHAYVVNDSISYESQLLHAVVERRAPLKGRLRVEYDGDGPDLSCKIIGHLRGEVEPLVYESPKIKDIKVKNSPLWVSDPRQQLFHYSSRAWARRYVPDVLLGAYSDDEMDGARHIGADNAKEVSPQPEGGLLHRLSNRAAVATGFSPDAINRTIEEAQGAPKETPAASVDAVGQATPTSEVRLSPGAAEVGVAEKSESSAAYQGLAEESAGSPAVTSGEILPRTEEPAPVPPAAETKTKAKGSAKTADPTPTTTLPTTGTGYIAYVAAIAAEASMSDDLQDFWKSAFERKLRNALVNASSAELDEARAIVEVRLKELLG